MLDVIGIILAAVVLLAFFAAFLYVTIPLLIEGATEGLAALWSYVPRRVRRWLWPR